MRTLYFLLVMINSIKIKIIKPIYPLVVTIALLLGACGTMVKPVSKEALENKTFVLVPTGQTNYEVSSNKTGGMFGVLGVLIEAAATQSSSDATKVKLRDAVPPEFLLQTATSQIEVSIKKYGNYNLKIYNNHTLRNAFHADWSKNTKRDDLKGIPEIDGDIIVDVGVTSVSLVKGLLGTEAFLWTSIRFINRNNGELHGEVVDFVGSSAAGVHVDLDENSKTYQTDVRAAFEKLVKASVDNALLKIFENTQPSTIQTASEKSQSIGSDSSQNKPSSVPSPEFPKSVEIAKSEKLNIVAPQSSSAQKMYELKLLLDQGLINQKDFDLKKREILKGM